MVETNDADPILTPWQTSQTLQPALDDHIQTIYSLSIDGGYLWYGWATQAPDGNDGFDPLLEPRFDLYLAFDALFTNGFEVD